MLHTLSLAIPVLLVIVGLVWAISKASAPRPRVSVRTSSRPRPRVSARELGLAHRLGARVLRSSRRTDDSEFAFLERYTVVVDTRAVAMVTPLAFWTAVDVGRPLLELEQLLESLEKLSTRMRAWRPGRNRGQS